MSYFDRLKGLEKCIKDFALSTSIKIFKEVMETVDSEKVVKVLDSVSPQ